MHRMYSCPNCGSRVPFGTTFCTNCGIPLNWPTQQQMQPPPVYQRLAEPPSGVQSSKAKTPRKWYAITTILTVLLIASAVLAYAVMLDANEWANLSQQYASELEETKRQLTASALENELELAKLTEHYTAEVEEAKFYFYYASLARPQYGTSDLRDYLSMWQWVPGAYKHGKFDCSEMAACLERNLEIVGFRTRIIAGDDPSGSGEKHAWLLVETSPDKYMPVEATAYAMVEHGNPNLDNYFVYDYDFGTIQEALEIGPTEFNWWEK